MAAMWAVVDTALSLEEAFCVVMLSLLPLPVAVRRRLAVMAARWLGQFCKGGRRTVVSWIGGWAVVEHTGRGLNFTAHTCMSSSPMLKIG